jgi:Phage terminase, small subunit
MAKSDSKTTKKIPKNAKKPTKDLLKTPLQNKQKIFIAEYLVDFNATRAAIAAGYKEKSARFIGNANIKKAHIKAIIEKQIEERKSRITFTADSVLEETAKVAFCHSG